MKSLLGVLLIFILAYALGVWLKQSETVDVSSVMKSDCDPSRQTCRLNNKGFTHEISFAGEPSPLVPFDVVLQAEGVISEATLQFDMEGMDMGYNIHQMKFDNDSWRTTVILPVCTLSRNDWILRLTVVSNGVTYVDEFRFAQPGR